MSSSPFLKGIVAGLAVGAAAVLLTAPKSGEQVRQILKQNSSTALANLADVKVQSKNVKQAITAFTNEAKNNIPAIINEVKNSLEAFKEEIQPITNNLSKEIEQLSGSISEIQKSVEDFQQKKVKETK